MAKMGAPTKYDPKYCAMLIEHMSEGLSFDSFAGVVGVCGDTCYEWAKVHKEFSEAKKLGTKKALLWFEKIANAAIMGRPRKNKKGEVVFDPKGFNSTVWVFSMKNKFNWRDRQETIDNPDGKLAQSEDDNPWDVKNPHEI